MSSIAPSLPDARVLDLFAGSGALGLEALSRGAAHATFVENDSTALRSLRGNLERLDAFDRATIVRADAMKFVTGLGSHTFDLAFADPPYGKGIAAELLELFRAVPFAALLCIEHRRTDPLPDFPGSREKRYGDTLLTFLPAPE